MTNRPIDLDGRRTPEGKIEIALRRSAANTQKQSQASGGARDTALDAAMLAEPARTWIEAMDKVRFLLDRFSATPEARDARIQKLIGRAMSDLTRLRKCEENSS